MTIKTVSITNQKGGVGKTTTAVNLAAALQIVGKKVLLVDMDHQGDSGKAMGYKIDELELTITDVLIDKIPVSKVMLETRMPGLFILLANQDLSAASLAMAGMTGREFLLQKSLSTVRDQFDYIIIDCPPQLGLLTVNSFAASDGLLLCCQMSNLALEGVMDLIKSYNMLKENMDYSPDVQKLSILGIVSTFYDARNSTINTEIINVLKDGFGDRLFETKIRLDLDLNKSQGVGQTIFEFDAKNPNSYGIEDYKKLAAEFIERTSKMEGQDG